jgi:hypothetical protein
MMRPTEPEPPALPLFEEWMGMTSQQWDELGRLEDDPDEPRLF